MRYFLIPIGMLIGAILVNWFKGDAFNQEDTAYVFASMATSFNFWLLDKGWL